SELNSTKKGGAKVTRIIFPVIFTGVLIVCVSSWFWHARRKKNHVEPVEEDTPRIIIDSKSQEEGLELPLFSFSTIADATANFSPDNKLGEGGFGPVYKFLTSRIVYIQGVLEERQQVAVKRLSRNSSQGLDEFKNEVICVSKLQHRNLVKLLGCCIQGDERLLIYEYMPNKSLDSFIFGKKVIHKLHKFHSQVLKETMNNQPIYLVDKAQRLLLDWTKRLHIIKGIARGLISDFGIARSFGGNESQGNTERVVGTGYMSPEYAIDGIFSMKSDVFSFGVLVLEIVSGKRNRGFTQQENGNNLMG
ncbi:hypothetical protein M8C21_023357, partial [Ambrosia artemisiifolia]